MGNFAFVSKIASKIPQDTKDAASAYGNAAKTFMWGQDQPEEQQVYPYREGPAPAIPTPQPPDSWYKQYGRYAPPAPVKK